MIALVTGASRGIGKCIADIFSKRGLTVLTPTRIEMNLESSESITRYINLQKHIDILVNCAGINELANLDEMTEELLIKTLQINLISSLLLIKGVTPFMKEQKWGRIVNFSSIWSNFSKERRITYSVSKAGIDGATRASAVELAKWGILVNAVAPGFVNTELTSQNNTPEQLKLITDALPIKRLAEPLEIAEMVYFLSSKQNTFMTGQTLYVAGGFSCV